MHHAPFVGCTVLTSPRCQGTSHDSLRKVGLPQAIWSDDATLERQCLRIGAPMSPQNGSVWLSWYQYVPIYPFAAVFEANKTNNIPIIVTHAHLVPRIGCCKEHAKMSLAAASGTDGFDFGSCWARQFIAWRFHAFSRGYSRMGGSKFMQNFHDDTGGKCCLPYYTRNKHWDLGCPIFRRT